jgi:Xaa-Pro aminopeptidase
MTKGDDRIKRVTRALQQAGLDALVCTLPANVLLLSGYWPAVGSAVAVATRDGRVAILAPVDERELAGHGWATEERTYHPGSLARLTRPAEAVRDPLAMLLRDVGVYADALGTRMTTPTNRRPMRRCICMGPPAPEAALTPAAESLTRLRSVKLPGEVGQMRLACALAHSAFTSGARRPRPSLGEPELAAAFARPLSVHGLNHAGVERAGGFTYCMSGPNSALAGSAYARTRAREPRAGDLVLVHCNSYVDGYWTDITRTYCLGAPGERQRAIYEAVFAARAAALAAILPRAQASEVDRAARAVLAERGFGKEFIHGLGHNLGFSAISTEFPPHLHLAFSWRSA